MFIRPSLLLSLLVCLFVLAGFALMQGLAEPFKPGVDQQILLLFRLPLVITAILVGAGLAVSSACLQVLLRNPLADPGIIGITSGASLFAAFLLLAGGEISSTYLQYLLPIACFIGALASTFVIYAIAKRLPGFGTSVILAGIAISTLSGAVIAWLHLVSDAQSMRNLMFWLMGSLHQADWPILMIAAPVMLLLLACLIGQGQKLNWFYFGATDAQLAGLDVKGFNTRMLLVSALLVGAAVSIAGSIAFVGLLVPHLLRNVFGHDNRFIMPASALVGAMLMVLVVVINNASTGISVPVSMLTATLGGPLFLYSIIRLGRQRV